MKKNGIIFLALVSLLIGCYFGYKGFNLYYYDVNNITTEDYDEFIKGLRINDTITLKKEVIPDEEYLEFNDFKVKNEFKDFKKLGYPESTEDSLKFALYDENNKVKASFWMSKAETYTKLLKSDKMLFGTEDKRITNDDLTSILEENGITNDVELFKFLEKQKNVKNNIFTSVKRMKKIMHFILWCQL